MRGVNKAIVVGIVGQDPQIRYTADGKSVCNLSVVTNESWKDKDGEKHEKPEWHRIVLFGRVAEIAGQYLVKGSQAYFEGKIQTRKWQDKDGHDRYSTEIVAFEMQMLGSSSKNKDNDASGSIGSQPSGSAPNASADDFKHDDIPF